MNILQIVPSGAWSGSEKIAFAIADYTAKNSNNNSYLVVKTNSLFSKEFYELKVSSKVNIIELPSNYTGAEAIHKYIIDVLGDDNINVDIAHGHLSLGCRVASRFSDSVYKVGHMHIRFFLPQFKQLDAVIAVSKWQLNDVPSWYKGEVHLVTNFLFDMYQASELEYELFQRRCYIDKEKFTYGVISRMHIEKGVDLVIRAFKDLPFTDISLIIIGSGKHISYFKELAEGDERIVFSGFLGNASSYIKEFNCLVSPSRADSFGLSVLEGLYAETPVISSATRGSIDIMADDPLLCNLDDVLDLKEKMILAYQGTKNTCDYRKFDLHNSCGLMLNIYNEFLLSKENQILVDNKDMD